MSDMQETVGWENSVPVFKNATILKQLGIATGIPFGLVALIIIHLYQGGAEIRCMHSDSSLCC